MAQDLEFQIIIEAQNRAEKELASLKRDVKSLSKDYKKTSRDLKNENRNLTSSFSWLRNIIIGAFAVDQVVKFWKEIFSTTVRLDQLWKKSKTVLWEFESEVRDTAKEVAVSMWLTSNEFVEATTNVADLLIPMEFTREEASKMSTELVSLSGALSEWTWWQRTAEDVARILSKAMLWEREQLKELGIAIQEADVQQRLLEKWQKDLTGTALQQAKAIATQELIFEKSTDAQEAFRTGGDSLIRKQQELQATLRGVKEEIAVALTPTILEITQDLADMVTTTLNNEETMESLRITMIAIGETIKFLTEGIINFNTYVWKALDSVAEFIVTAQRAVWMWPKLSDRERLNFLWISDSRLWELGFEWRANWWPVSSWTPYVVWERWPELFVPKQSWTIIPNWASPQVSISMWTININNWSDERRLTEKIERTVVWALQRYQLANA